MKITFCFLFACTSVMPPLLAQKPNSLTSEEKKNGWVLLFDGTNTSQWITPDGKPLSSANWIIQNGELGLKPVKGKNYTDIITTSEYSNFDLTVDFKTTTDANSGIKYFFTDYEKGGKLGMEYQIIDDEVNIDAKEGINGNRKCGSLYDILPASSDKKLNPVGQWNTARIVSKGKHVEHWLNGKKILEFERGSKEYLDHLKQSKFANVVPVFGTVAKGHILLQYHLSEVWFRNIKIKTL
jgi:hypothetical protein